MILSSLTVIFRQLDVVFSLVLAYHREQTTSASFAFTQVSVKVVDLELLRPAIFPISFIVKNNIAKHYMI